MSSKHDYTTTIWAIDVLRRYAPDPLAQSDDEYRRFKRECERDANLRRELDPRSDEQFFMDEQSPSDSTFR
jgi:hypothetical protein